MAAARPGQGKGAVQGPPPHRSGKRQDGRPLTRVFSGPPVAFHISSIESIMSSSSFAAPASSDCFTFEACFVGLPERLVDAGMLLEVLGLEVVVPEDVEVVLDELGALLLDVDAAGLEELVVAGIVLLDDAQARFGLDAGLLRVVDAARDVAVGVERCRVGRSRVRRVSIGLLSAMSTVGCCARILAAIPVPIRSLVPASELSWFGQLPITMPPSTPSTWPVT